MGSSQSKGSPSSTAATISSVGKESDNERTKKSKAKEHVREEYGEVPHHANESKVLQTPILMADDGEDKNGDVKGKDLSSRKRKDEKGGEEELSFPVPTGHEYDLMDQIASELPSIIDDESRAQVEEYINSCDNGKGPMVACYSTAEYLSLFLRKHKDAVKLYENTCFRPKTDKSPNGVLVDNTKAYPPSCFNLAQMRLTGKGDTKFDRKEGYDLFDRACKAGHGGSCHMQAKMLASYPGAMGPGIPYNPQRAAELLQGVCDNGDSLSCFTLATMLLRGDRVSAEADNVSPQEARGEQDIKIRENEADRRKRESDKRKALQRDPKRAEQLLLRGCDRGHAPSCYNIAVMYTQGDEGVPANAEKAKVYQEKTEELVKRFGGFGFGGSMG